MCSEHECHLGLKQILDGNCASLEHTFKVALHSPEPHGLGSPLKGAQ
jgi:hypothetical protein